MPNGSPDFFSGGATPPDRIKHAVVTDEPLRWSDIGVYQVAAARLPVRAPARVPAKRKTEWLLLTSGTSGPPKLVMHDLRGRAPGETPEF